jgi:hypothetical protein
METITISKVLQLFNRLSRPEQLAVAEKISQQTFEDRWQLADKELPDTTMNEDDIMNEVRAVR